MTMESLKQRWDEWVISLKNKKGGASGGSIKSAQIVYVFGPMGTGKSFTGDYMTVMHDYHHVDGDIPLKHMCLVPEYKELMQKTILEDDWAPYFSELARLTLEGAKDNDKVVLSHATYKNEMRDHVIKKLIEGGASEDKITIIQLTIDPKVKARGLYHRTARQAEQSGMTMTECCKASLEFEGEMTEEKFIDIVLGLEAEQPEDFFEVHPKAIMVDISGRDVTHFDNVDKALGLTRSTELSYESICAKVKPIDEARDKIVMESGFMEAIAEIAARAEAEAGQHSSLAIEEEGEDEKKVEEMKKRRSTIVQFEVSMRGMSSRSLSLRDTSEGVEARRKSLITTGKICEE
mmetsp:Transcript_11915/g.17599  ORF Transcript_11915/g.17599 Transcript_11915/m.17599 type:complete len:348 (+) Transcript_11915:65-1108(+)